MAEDNCCAEMAEVDHRRAYIDGLSGGAHCGRTDRSGCPGSSYKPLIRVRPIIRLIVGRLV